MPAIYSEQLQMVAIYTLVGKHHLKFHETGVPFTAIFPALLMAPSMAFVFNKYLLTDFLCGKIYEIFSSRKVYLLNLEDYTSSVFSRSRTMVGNEIQFAQCDIQN